MHYVYPETNQPVPAGVEVVRVPPGISEKHPLGGFFTSEGVQVTALKDGADAIGIAPAQDPTAYTKVDLIQEIREQLNRIEAKLDS